ncbi:MAG: transposase [Methylococcales bacterium]|nr:transposase [Methylococcales bacterium]
MKIPGPRLFVPFKGFQRRLTRIWQAGVFATLCRGDMATLIDARLYLPEAWRNDDERCRKAAIPEDKRLFQSKTQLALAMLKIAQQRGIQFGYVGIGRRLQQGTGVSAWRR